MVVIATCRTCGREFEPETSAIRAGTWRDGCPYCRPPGAPKRAPTPVRLLRSPVPDPRRIPGLDGLDVA